MVDFECKGVYDLNDFVKLIAVLRSENGCPWDREQTHESIRRNLLEEAYEVCEAIDEGDAGHLREELGDLMMQVIFHAGIEQEAGRFNIDDVADAACKKLIRRHPHIFSDIEVSGADEVLKNWDEIKRAEREQATQASSMAYVAKSLPALWRAEKIQGKAKKVGFDWPDASGAADKLNEELGELMQAMRDDSPDNIREELGDLLFAAVNLSRLVGVDAEMALHESSEKFIRRFSFIEDEAGSRGLRLEDMSLEEMEELYQLGKSGEKKQ